MQFPERKLWLIGNILNDGSGRPGPIVFVVPRLKIWVLWSEWGSRYANRMDYDKYYTLPSEAYSLLF